MYGENFFFLNSGVTSSIFSLLISTVSRILIVFEFLEGQPISESIIDVSELCVLLSPRRVTRVAVGSVFGSLVQMSSNQSLLEDKEEVAMEEPGTGLIIDLVLVVGATLTPTEIPPY